jgi:hypothetical protein
MLILRRAVVAGAVFLVTGVSTIAHAQTELTGRVVSDNGTPIAGATVTLASLRYSVRTDSLGRFKLSGTPGSMLNLSLQAAGYRGDTASVVLPRTRTIVRDFALISEAEALPIANPSDRALLVRVTAMDGAPIAYANVQVNRSRRYLSDDSGRVTVPFAASGAISVLVRRIGFEPTEVKLASMPDTAVRVRMAMVARTLEAQTVTVRSPFIRLDLGGFYARMKEVERGARVGYFVTPEDLAMRNPKDVTDAVEQFPNIRLRPIKESERCRNPQAPAGSMCGFPHAGRMRIEDRSGCPLTVYLDRVRIQPTMIGLEPIDQEVNSIVQPQSVAGIEVYPRSAGSPPEFQPVGNTCGVVVIWSK